MSPTAPAASSTGATNQRALETLDTFAAKERSTRMAGGYSALIVGGSSIAGGLLAELEYDRGFGRPIWIIGAVVAGGGLVSLFVPGPLERLSAESALRPAAELQIEWAARARAAESSRYLGGGITIGLGAVSAGAGGAIAAGLGDLEETDKENWSVALILLGGALIGGGLTTLFVESEVETGYQAAYGADASHPPPVALGVSLSPGGGALTLGGDF